MVHINHGIGQYMGIEALQVDNRSKDYLNIRYAGKDRLYVPTDQIQLLQRYVGLDEGAPRLSKLGGVMSGYGSSRGRKNRCIKWQRA